MACSLPHILGCHFPSSLCPSSVPSSFSSLFPVFNPTSVSVQDGSNHKGTSALFLTPVYSHVSAVGSSFSPCAGWGQPLHLSTRPSSSCSLSCHKLFPLWYILPMLVQICYDYFHLKKTKTSCLEPTPPPWLSSYFSTPLYRKTPPNSWACSLFPFILLLHLLSQFQASIPIMPLNTVLNEITGDLQVANCSGQS